MPLNMLYWLLMILWFIFSAGNIFRPAPYFLWGGNLLMFILFLLIGLRIFGSPIT